MRYWLIVSDNSPALSFRTSLRQLSSNQPRPCSQLVFAPARRRKRMLVQHELETNFAQADHEQWSAGLCQSPHVFADDRQHKCPLLQKTRPASPSRSEEHT